MSGKGVRIQSNVWSAHIVTYQIDVIEGRRGILELVDLL